MNTLKRICLTLWLAVFAGVLASAQEINVSGNVIDKTYGEPVIGAAVMILVNVFGVRALADSDSAYMACAWGGFAGYGVAMIMSWILGQHYYPVKYDWKALGGYTLLAAALLAVSFLLQRLFCSDWLLMALDTILLLVFCAAVFLDLRRGFKRN